MNRAISLPLKGAAWLLLVLALPFANAQDMNKTAPQTFVSEASAAGVAEIEAGKMALEKSTAADVKVFAKQMIDDHGKVNAELRSLAERKKLEVEDDASLTDKAKATCSTCATPPSTRPTPITRWRLTKKPWNCSPRPRTT